MIIDNQEYLNEKEIASLCGLSLRWVKGIRYQHKDFPFYKLNGRVYFKPCEVNKWLKENLKPGI